MHIFGDFPSFGLILHINTFLRFIDHILGSFIKIYFQNPEIKKKNYNFYLKKSYYLSVDTELQHHT